MLVTRGAKQTWKHPETGEALNFDALVPALQRHWAALSPKFPNVDDVTVIGIDLGKRFEAPQA